MPDPDLKSRDRFGMRFDGPVYRDGVFLIRDRNADSAIPTAPMTLQPFIAPTGVAPGWDGIKPSGGQLQTANITSGMVDMASGDGLEISFAGAGADNATGTWAVFAYDPVFSASDTGKQTITGYHLRIVARGTLLLSGLTLGTAGAAALLGGTGIVSGDRVADTLTQTITCTSSAGVNSGGYNELTLDATADQTIAVLRIGARGARFLRVLTATGTSTALYAFGRRYQGGGAGAFRA